MPRFAFTVELDAPSRIEAQLELSSRLGEIHFVPRRAVTHRRGVARTEWRIPTADGVIIARQLAADV